MKSSSLMLFVAAIAACGGCSSSESLYSSTTTKSRTQAAALADKVSAYRQEQSDRVDRLNAGFDDAYRRLIIALDEISSQQLLTDRDEEAQRISDLLISSPNASLRQAFRDHFLSAEQKDQAEITQADLSLAAARSSYQQAHQTLSVPITKLRKVEQDLRDLSKVDENADEQNLAKLAQKVFSAFQSLSNQTLQKKNPVTAKAAS
jgi:exonuclease VII small subunit